MIPYSQVKLQVAKYMQLKRLQDPLSQTWSHILYSFMQSIQTNQFTKIVLLPLGSSSTAKEHGKLVVVVDPPNYDSIDETFDTLQFLRS